MYIKPEIEVILFQNHNIVRTSNTGYGGDSGDGEYEEF